MRRLFAHGALCALATLTLACNDNTRPKGPVTLRFIPAIHRTSTSTPDTVHAFVTMDDSVGPIQVPGDSLTDVARGTHTFHTQTDTYYLPADFSENINPKSSSMTVRGFEPATCRLYQLGGYYVDAPYCQGHNWLTWSGSRRILCPVNDYGEFCTKLPDAQGVGATWPADSAATQLNYYISHGKLLIGAVMGGDGAAGTAGDTLAMNFYDVTDPGDYSPHVRVHVVSGDSSRFQAEAWTDARHVALAPFDTATLAPTDRVGDNFGLAVRSTYYLPSAYPNALFIRWDITNISNDSIYRYVHREEPAGGHTVTDIYLAPIIDPDIGGLPLAGADGAAETSDDNATEYLSDSMVVAYDQNFEATTLGGGYEVHPGMVGMRLVGALPAGATARGLLFPRDLDPTWLTQAQEDLGYELLAGGRAGTPNACAVDGTSSALVCVPETSSDVRIGWSIGPIASLAPGQSVSLTVALVFATPAAGKFTSGTSVPPQNTLLGDTTRAIYRIGLDLRQLGAQVAGVSVNGAPSLSLFGVRGAAPRASRAIALPRTPYRKP